MNRLPQICSSMASAVSVCQTKAGHSVSLGMRLVAVSLLLVLGGHLTAQAAVTPHHASEQGLQALLELQRADGGFGHTTAISALAGMALLAGGHTPTRGAYREASARCLENVLAAQDPISGYLGDGPGHMYAHGFCTLYLAECYGMTPHARLRRSLQAALELIFRSQNSEGGWRYAPAPQDADISVTVCQINAIRAAYNVGLGGDRAQQVAARGVDYVRRCHLGNGSFKYKLDSGKWGAEGPDGVARSAAGAMSLIGAGVTDTSDSVLGPALNFLRKYVPPHLESANDHYFWYGQYYASQALFHSPDPSDWQRYWDLAWPKIIGLQRGDGRWAGPDSWGDAYNTAMALIILQIPNNYLPIFQR